MRTFQSLKIVALEAMFLKHYDDPNIVEQIARELGLRKTTRAAGLKQRVIQRIAVGFRNRDFDAMVVDKKAEEKSRSETLSPQDQEWIKFMLDMRGLPPQNMPLWQQIFGIPTVLAACDTINQAVGEARHVNATRENVHQCKAFQPMIDVAIFSMTHDKCKGFEALQFLHERLFGGAMRPFFPSVFAACSTHPVIVFNAPTVLMSAADWDSCQNDEDAAWFPN